MGVFVGRSHTEVNSASTRSRKRKKIVTSNDGLSELRLAGEHADEHFNIMPLGELGVNQGF